MRSVPLTLRRAKEFQTDTTPGQGYCFDMSFTEVMAELPALTVSERQVLIHRALELDEPALSAEDGAVVERRLADQRENPGSAMSLDEMKARLRARFSS